MRPLKHFLVPLLLLVCVAPVRGFDDPPATKKPKQSRWALLVGVDDYNQAQDLQYCGADQRAFREKLIGAGFPDEQVFVLHDEAKEKKYLPFKANIDKQLDLVLGLVEKDDIIVLSFSGHGMHFGGKSYICPTDARLDDPASLVPLDSVYDRLKKSPAAFKLVLVDACRNDPRPGGQRSLTPTEGTRQFAESLQKERPPEGLLLINSCAPGEISWEEKEFGHGVFMHFLMEGMDGQADDNNDGKVTLYELTQYARKKTSVYVARKFNDSQRPFIKTDTTLEALDFDLGKRIAKATTSPKSSPLPADAPKTLTNSIEMKFTLIPAGEFEMGDYIDRPIHRVRISQPYYLGIYEVTQSQYERVTGTNPSWFSKTGPAKDRVSGLDTSDSPVEFVSWNDAQEFCRKLSALNGEQPNGRRYRLPTEAEWEYACRAGTKTKFHFGDVLNGDKANVDGKLPEGTTTEGPSLERATSVGRYGANAFGLYDMHGNVGEWCEDVYNAKAYSQRSGLTTDPFVTSGSENRVMRGGSFDAYSRGARSANRYGIRPVNRNYNYGFRVVCEPTGVTSSNNPGSLRDAPTSSGDINLIGKRVGEERSDNGLKLALVWCPPGEFRMGSPPGEKGRATDEEQVDVVLTRGSWLGKYEVTQEQWSRVMSKKPWMSELPQLRSEGPTYPASSVSWDLAKEFCEKMTASEQSSGRLPKEWQYTLPTEAQWEYACRSGTTTRYSFGNDESKLSEYTSRYEKDVLGTQQVGRKKPNAWGLYDMHGNVWEWCADVYVSRLPGGTDPEVKSGDTLRVLRGGGPELAPQKARSASRLGTAKSYGNGLYGFRVALSKTAE